MALTYWPSGLIKQINYANGTVTNYNQNSRLWPSSFSTQNAAATKYLNSAYAYDGVGNLTSISDTADTTFNRTLGYDNLNRLTTVNGPWGSGTVAYNGAGNITSQVLGSDSLYYTYDASNRLSGVSGLRTTSYGYDAYGDIVSGMGNTYTYDGAPNLTCFNCGDANSKVEYAYDATHKRARVIKGGVTSYEMHGANGNQLIEYTPSQSNKLVEYIHLGGKRVAQRETTQ